MTTLQAHATRTLRAKTTPASTAGSFAAHAHGASEIVLDDDRALPVPGEDYQAMRQQMDQALASARHWARSYDLSAKQGTVVDADDVAQEAMVAVLMATRAGKRTDAKGYAHVSARKIVANAASDITRHEDRKATAMFLERAESLSAELGRTLTTEERNQIAADIREGWHDPRHRPTVDFHTNRRRFTSLDATLGSTDSDERAGDALATAYGLTTSIEDATTVESEGVYGARAMDALEPETREIHTARRLAWNALAEASEVPLVEEGSLGHRASAVRATMGSYPGGVLSAAATWERGITDAGTEALFAPWPEASESDRDAIAAHLTRLAGYADDLWGSAVSLGDMRMAVRAYERARG